MTKFWEIGKKSVCILRNYVAHAKELNNPLPKKPIYFIKPTTAYLQENSGPILLPKGSDVHHEVELGVVIGETCTNVDENDSKTLNLPPIAMKAPKGHINLQKNLSINTPIINNNKAYKT